MSGKEAAELIATKLNEWQEACGNAQQRVDLACKPLKDLKDFDSMAAVALIGRIAKALGLNIPTNCNPFKSKDGQVELTVEQIAKQFLAMHKPPKAT